MIYAALLLALSLIAAAVPQPDPAPDPFPISPQIVIAGAREAYRSSPVADDLTIRFTSESDQSRTARIVVRMDAHDPDADPRFRLEFDASPAEPILIISFDHGTLAAANSGNENDRWIVPGAGPDLASILAHLPPIPIPQLRLAFDPTFGWDQATPYTPDVAWDTAETPVPGPLDRPEVILRGRSFAGPVTAAFDADTLRLRSFRAELEGGRILDISSRPIPPGDPASWPLTTAGRDTVPGLSDLTPQRGPIAPGKFVPDISDNTGWSLHAALASLPIAPAEPATPTPAIALIVFRVPSDPIQLAAAEASARLALQAVQIAASAPAPGPATLHPHLIAAIELAAEGEAAPALQQRWGAEAALGLMPGWATPGHTIARFDLQANAVLALIGPDRRLWALILLDDQSDSQRLADGIMTIQMGP